MEKNIPGFKESCQAAIHVDNRNFSWQFVPTGLRELLKACDVTRIRDEHRPADIDITERMTRRL